MNVTKLLCYRVAIIITLYLGYVFYTLTRKSIIFMLPHFSSNSHSNASNSLNITKNDIGIIISSQNLAYALSKFFFGVLSDFASCRILFGSGLFLSGILNIGFKKEITVYNLYGLAFLIGLAQGPSWPACAKIQKKWLPKAQFGTWWAILSTSANVAGALGPMAATFIAINYHWSIGFMVLGCVCMSVGYLSIIILRNKPSDLGFPELIEDEPEQRLNEIYEENSEQDSENDDKEEEKELTRFEQTRLILKYPFFVSICLVYFLVQLVKTLYSDVAQMYLIKVIKIDPYRASYFISCFEFMGLFGTIFSGFITDLLFHYKTKKESKKKEQTSPIQIRFALIIIYMICLIICMHLFNFFVNVGVSDMLLMSIGSIAGALSYGSIALLGVIAMEFTTDEFSGTSHAIAALFANIGAVFAGLPFSIISRYFSWNFGFKLVEGFSLIVLIILIIFRNSKKLFVPITAERKNQ